MATQSASDSVNLGASSSQLSVLKVIPTKRNPTVWQHFDLCVMSSGPNKARCKYCQSFLKHDANSTLRDHIEKPYCRAIKERRNSEGQSSFTQDGELFVYNMEAVREGMANFVIQESLPFNHFDNPRLTRLIQKTLQPRYTHVSRATLRRDCLKRWKEAKNELISYFENLNTGVNLTSDVWSAPHGSPDSYICVTAHWIEPSTWQMMKRTIAFRLFDYPHTGTNIFLMIDHVIQTYKLQNKVLSISFDNASNNTAAITQLKLKYKPICDGVFFHSRCVAHIINLAVQDGLRVIESQKDGFRRMLRDIFSRIQTHAKYIKYCKTSNAICLGPNWDCPTRWNSTCNMFEKHILQKESLIAFHSKLVNRGKASPYHPAHWNVIEVVTEMLQVFKSATTALSGVYYPTSSITLHKIYLMVRKLTEMECRGSPYSDMAATMKAKFKKYFSELPAVFTCASALNPCYNIGGVENLIEKISNDLNLNTEEDPLFSQGLIQRFNKHLTDMYDVYFQRYGQISNIQVQMRQASQNILDYDYALYNDLMDESNKRARGNAPSSELGRYGATNYIINFTPEQFKSFDLLAWWKSKEDQFPVLSSMARDLLTVQASTVASESAFSVSGRVISIRRTRLTPPSVEMSICLKDYLDSVERVQDQRSLEGELEYEAQLYEDEVNGDLTQPMTDEEAEIDDWIRSNSGSGDD